MAYSIKLAGQDITQYVDQMSVKIVDSLGQSSGAGAGSLQQGRAGTIEFNTSLGPMNTAIGAGSAIPNNDYALLFNGSTGYASIPAATNGSGWSVLSVAFWFNLSTTSLGSVTNFISGDSSYSNNKSYEFYLSGTSTFIFELGNGTTFTDLTYSVTPAANTWYFVVGTWDGTTMKLYWNGSQVASAALSGTVGTSANAPVIGANATASGNFLPGSMNELEIGNYTLSASEVASRYAGRTGLATAYKSLVLARSPKAYYRFEERIGATTIADSSGNGYTGSLSGGVTPGSPGFLGTVPALVRQGEIIVTDATNTVIWGGYATKFTDTTNADLGHSKQNFTTVDGVDYEAQLARVIVNESFVTQTDVQIISFVLGKYAPWIGQTFLPPKGLYTFPVKNFRNVTVLQVIQTIAGVTGYMIWVDFAKQIHYMSPASAQTAPIYLSDTPDFISSFPHNVQEFIQDDNSAVNRVTFYGGKTPSGDFIQDVSPLANGNNKVFPTAWYPRLSSDGKFHIQVNGAEQVIGYATGATSPANTFKSAGGLADVLINPDAHNFTFDVAPASGATVTIKYRYEYPLTIIVTDEASHAFFGNPYLDGSLSDQNVFDKQTGVQRCKVMLAQQSFGLVSLKVDCWQSGLRAGMMVKVVNAIRGVNKSYLIQEVDVEPLGGGNFVYHLTCGAWNWNMIDIMVKLAQAAAVNDQTAAEAPSLLQVQQVTVNANTTTTWVKKSETTGPYYARSTAVGDGHDAYPGFATISS